MVGQAVLSFPAAFSRSDQNHEGGSPTYIPPFRRQGVALPVAYSLLHSRTVSREQVLSLLPSERSLSVSSCVRILPTMRSQSFFRRG